MSKFTITPSEVKQELLELKLSKAAGPDGVHPAILKPLADVLAEPLAKLFNQSLYAGNYPQTGRGSNQQWIDLGYLRYLGVGRFDVGLTTC
ncbi:unnamed protein product [Echinostoma caproni]|uniref:Transketolase n=1 Tax=Echinostoma caproni TaxID=27848 RepID=A0A183B2Z6_9TREM|nr:unnamed protein product [Echinostoma caproni]